MPRLMAVALGSNNQFNGLFFFDENTEILVRKDIKLISLLKR